MKTPDNFYNILFVVHQLNTDILKKIKDYEVLIMNSDDIKDKFYNIEFVYMHSIILDIAKLTSATGSDNSGIKDLIKISPPNNIKQEFEKLLSDNSSLLEKVRINRNRIIAHIDVSEQGSYMKMGFSQVEIERKIEDYKKYLKLIHIKPSKKDLDVITKFQEMKSSSDIERYSPSDFSLDLPAFKKLLGKIIEISNKLNQHFYQNN